MEGLAGPVSDSREVKGWLVTVCSRAVCLTACDAVGMPHCIPPLGWGTQGMHQHRLPLVLQDPVLHLFGDAGDVHVSW